MKNYRGVRKWLNAVLVLGVAGMLTFAGCTEVDDTLGYELVPGNQQMEMRLHSIRKGFEARMFMSDSVKSSNLSYGYFGTTKSDTFGIRKVGFMTQYLWASISDRKNWYGYRPIFDSLQLLLSVSSYAGDTLQPQRFGVYRILNNDYLKDNDGNGYIDSGEILFNGQDLTKLSMNEMYKIRGNEISVIFQEPMTSLNPVFTVSRQISEPLMIHQGMNKKQAAAKAVELLSDVKIPNPEVVAKQYPHQLSGGMRQRVMIAMALACRPKLLIADEPTTALDVTIQAQILKLMNELREKNGTAVLFITHDLGVINQMADNVAVMYCGQVVEYAPAETIFHKNEYSHPYTEGLMLSIPRLDTPSDERLEAIPGAVPHPLDLPKGCKFAPRCKYATERCLEEEPELIHVSDTQQVRCFYAKKEDRHAK